MPIAKQNKTFTPVPAGTHIARAVHCISLGTQPAQGEFLATFKVMLGFEIPDEVVIHIETKEEKPMLVSKEYSRSLGKKANLRRDLESWRGREFTTEELNGFPVENVLDKPCMLNVIHKTSATGNTYAVIASISPLPKGVKCKDRVHELLHYEIEQGKSCPEWEKLPEFIKAKISQCEEWVNPAVNQPTTSGAPINPTGDDDNSEVPF